MKDHVDLTVTLGTPRQDEKGNFSYPTTRPRARRLHLARSLALRGEAEVQNARNRHQQKGEQMRALLWLGKRTSAAMKEKI